MTSTRKPAVFDVGDTVSTEPEFERDVAAPAGRGPAAPAPGTRVPLATRLHQGLRWGALLSSAAAALASLALALWFGRLVSIALVREDWIGWAAFALLAVMAISAAAILLREIVGYFRLTRLARLKQQADASLRDADTALERATTQRIVDLLSDRPELQWSLSRVRDHAQGVRDPGDLLRIADRELLAPLDGQARRLVAQAARRVSVATAISPMPLIAVVWVLVENLRLLRTLAAVYGGRAGFVGTARLARMVFAHIIATGGIALTDDLFGQFLGQDILRRLSRRLGEGIFNGALTARIGAAAIQVIRPLPFLETRPVRARDFLSELAKGTDAPRQP
jgi:putative membrane protein